jgi:4-hydroxy-tetrahydrodipicolinate synthase
MPRLRQDANLKLSGSICALVTPFAGDASLDEAAVADLIDLHLSSGTHGLVIAGSTGEAAMLSPDEYRRVIELAVARVGGRIPVLAGTGAAGTARTIELTRIARDCGVDAALVVTPFYVRPTQEGLYRHYMAVADVAGVPVVLYNVPGRTGCDLAPDTVARLKSHDNIVAVKEAVATPARIDALLALQDDGFAVLSGDDPTALEAMSAGARGVISVAANVLPGAFAELCDHALAGRADAARALDGRLRPLYDMLGAEPNPVPAKWLMSRLGLCGSDPRLPLVPLSANLHARADAVLAGLADLHPRPAG